MKTFLSLSIISIIFLAVGLFVLKPSFAAVRCEVQYGGQQVCVRIGALQVNKEIFDPKNNKFADNLVGTNDHKFGPGEEVRFRVTVKNTGDAKLETVNVMDTLPKLLTTGDGNPFFQLKDLEPGKSEQREIKVKVVASDKFPADKTFLCVVNAVEAVSGDQKDRDTAELCLERKVFPKELPPTGPEHWLLAGVASLFSLTSGIYLVRLSKKNSI